MKKRKDNRTQILQEWEKMGIDISYVSECLKEAECHAKYYRNLNKDERFKKELAKEKDILRKISNLTNQLPQHSVFKNPKLLSKYKYYLMACEFVLGRKKGRPNSPIFIPLTRIWTHLSNVVSIPAYGKENALPEKYQRDILRLFREISEEDFPPALSLNTLSQRVSQAKKQHSLSLKLSPTEYLL